MIKCILCIASKDVQSLENRNSVTISHGHCFAFDAFRKLHIEDEVACSPFITNQFGSFHILSVESDKSSDIISLSVGSLDRILIVQLQRQ